LCEASLWYVGTSASPSAGPRKWTEDPGAYRGFLLPSSTRPSIPSPRACPLSPVPPPPLPPRYARDDAAALAGFSTSWFKFLRIEVSADRSLRAPVADASAATRRL
jgi:hypothetical protein